MPLPTIRQALASLTLGLALTAPAPARADLILNTPAGLNPGDQFRIAFVTNDRRAANSADIAVYNSFVNDNAISQAGGGSNVVKYDTTVLNFKVWGSTTSVNAVTNIGTYEVPVFLANGTRITNSDGASGLLSGSLLNPINSDLLGNSVSDAVATASSTDGTGANPFVLGYFNIIYGLTNSTNSLWTYNSNYDSNSAYRFYAFSQVLTVATVPEPGTLAGAAVGGMLTLLAIARRRYDRAA